jgi:hypothetical protein
MPLKLIEMYKNLKQPLAGSKNTKQLKPLQIETISSDHGSSNELNEVRLLIEFLYLDVKVRSPQEVSNIDSNFYNRLPT